MADTTRDEHDIANLLIRWGQARDADDWESLSGCFHPDATIHISWMSGSATDFLAGSKAMSAKRPPGAHTKHMISGPWIKVHGDRAFSRCHANLYSRAMFDGHEFDFEALFRFFDQLEKRDNTWRLLKRVAVYEKDRMMPVDPRGVPDEFYDEMDLSSFQPETRFLSYRHSRTGVSDPRKLTTVYSPEEAALKAECEDWLAQG